MAHSTPTSVGHGVELTDIADGQVGARRRESLPWEMFLPGEPNPTNRSRIRASGGSSDFGELLEEGKKRLEKAEKEELLRERAEAVGHMGGGALDDVLVDLHEPTFSRRQNERLRQDIATKLRAKVARIFGRVMCECFSGPDPAQRSEEDSLARATAKFRVKLQRLLNKTNLGEIQKQVARKIDGRTSTSTTRTRRCCCINTHETERLRQGTPRTSAGPTSRSTRAVARMGSANSNGTKPHPPPQQTSKAVPPVGSGGVYSRRPGARPYSHSSTRFTAPRAVGDKGSGKGTKSENECHTRSNLVGEIDQTHGDSAKPEAPLDAAGSLDEADVCRESSGESPPSGSSDGSASDEAVEFYRDLMGGGDNWSDSKRISSDNELTSTSSEESVTVLRVGDTCEEEDNGENVGAQGGEPHNLPMEESRSPLVEHNRSTTRPRKDRKLCRRHHRKGPDGDRDAKMPAESSGLGSRIVLDESWSVRSLTVLLKEFGLYQPCQRALLSNHLPAELFGEDGHGGKNRGLPPSPRIDRPHFTPELVELPEAGKGRTLLMCPEPVAPGYDFSDVFAEVVKMHAPVGQLILEDIERGNVVTRSDALAHAAYFENDSVADQGKLLVAEFLADGEVGDALASAVAVELDLALCAEAGTLFDVDML